jgi:peptide deformylase
MSALLELYVTLEKLETMVKTIKAKNLTGIGLTLSISDETNNYGQNVSVFISQKKEEREAKKEKYYIGNGKVFWTDGSIKLATKKEAAKKAEPMGINQEEDDDFPF